MVDGIWKCSMCLDTVYLAKNWKLITENNKKIISELLFTAENIVHYCSFVLMHCSCARGAGKKKRGGGGENAEMWTTKRDPNGVLI